MSHDTRSQQQNSTKIALRKNLEVAFVIDSLAPGGAEHQCALLIEQLRSRGHYVTLFCLHDVESHLKEITVQSGAKYIFLPRKSRFDLSLINRLTKELRQQNFDLVHTFNNLGSLVGVTAAKLASIPSVCSGIRDASDKNAIFALSKHYFAWLSGILVSNSKAGFDARFRKTKPNFRVVYNGINPHGMAKTPVETRQRIRKELVSTVPENMIWIGMVATLSEYKDHETLINAFQIVRRIHPNAHLIIIGDGPKRKGLAELASSLDVHPYIHFLGYRRDAKQLAGLLDVCVLLSKHKEGISNALTEAMLQEVPCVATEEGGTIELFAGGLAGLLVPPSDTEATAKAMARILGDPELAKRVAEQAREHVLKMFHVDRLTSDYLKIYEGLLKEK